MEAITGLFGLIKLILIIRILLSWFPNINWWNQPFKFIREVTEPVLEPFRRLIPPVAGFDLSPLVIFILLDVLENILLALV